MILYVFSQCAGALTASGILCLLFPQNALLGATLPAVVSSAVICARSDFNCDLNVCNFGRVDRCGRKGITAGIAVGAVIGLEAMFAGPICGASMNPARSLAPALISGFATRLDISRRSGNRCLRWGVRLPLCTRVGMLFESARRYEPTCQKGVKFLIDLRAPPRDARAIFLQFPVGVTN